MVPYREKMTKNDLQLDMFTDAKRLFGIDIAIIARDKKTPNKWWASYGDKCPELRKLAIQVLSLTCSSSKYEYN